MSKQANLSELTEQALATIATAKSLKDLDVMRVEYLGKKGQLTALLKTLGQLPSEERSAAGAMINSAKQSVQSAIENHRLALETAALAERLANERIDVTLPSRQSEFGSAHPVSYTHLTLPTKRIV